MITILKKGVISLEMMNPDSVIELPVGYNQKLRGIAFDGSFFYITAPRECVIYKFNRRFAATESIKVNRPYAAICYDVKEKCFWVTEDKYNNILLKLNHNLKEIGQLEIKTDKELCGPIKGLSYDCEKNVLLAAYQNYIVEISKQSGRVNVLRGNNPGDYMAVLSMAPYYAFIWLDRCQSGKNQEVRFYLEKDRLVKSLFISEKYRVQDFIFYPCKVLDRSEFELIFLVTECGNSVILRYTMKACGITPDCCNYKVCKKDEEENCCKPCDCKPCDCKTCKCNACSELLASIALVEAALAHILNAEGEKLQKTAEIAKDVCELLEVNNSVNKTILGAAHLEFMLINKLEAINNVCTKVTKCK